MARARRVELGVHTLFSILATGDGTLNTLAWWVRYRGELRIRFGWAVLAESQANMVTKPGIESANSEADAPTAAVLGAQTKTSTGIVYPNAWITTSWTTATDGKQLWRPALYVQNANGTAPQNVRVFAWYELEDC
jgi:hypothetical protein